jgi:hypothetical protein
VRLIAEKAMRFSWTGLLLAPLAVPLIACAVMAPLLKSDEASVVLPFLILLIPACVIAYAMTIFVFLPSLFLLSLWRPLTGRMVSALGFFLGVAVILPVTWLAWKTSGPDSGPPAESFLTFFPRWATDPLMLFFPIAGLVTAALYWWLGTRRSSRTTTLAATKN